jgi:hypothetical protein
MIRPAIGSVSLPGNTARNHPATRVFGSAEATLDAQLTGMKTSFRLTADQGNDWRRFAVKAATKARVVAVQKEQGSNLSPMDCLNAKAERSAQSAVGLEKIVEVAKPLYASLDDAPLRPEPSQSQQPRAIHHAVAELNLVRNRDPLVRQRISAQSSRPRPSATWPPSGWSLHNDEASALKMAAQRVNALGKTHLRGVIVAFDFLGQIRTNRST